MTIPYSIWPMKNEVERMFTLDQLQKKRESAPDEESHKYACRLIDRYFFENPK
jgi:hypothetical protein